MTCVDSITLPFIMTCLDHPELSEEIDDDELRPATDEMNANTLCYANSGVGKLERADRASFLVDQLKRESRQDRVTQNSRVLSSGFPSSSASSPRQK